jgi:hypothetical protein
MFYTVGRERERERERERSKGKRKRNCPTEVAYTTFEDRFRTLRHLLFPLRDSTATILALLMTRS